MYFKALPKYPNVWMVVKKVFLISHVQASVERAFSINKGIMGANLSAATRVAHTIVKDFNLYVGDVEKVDITDNLITLRIQARRLYQEVQDQKKANEENSKWS